MDLPTLGVIIGIVGTAFAGYQIYTNRRDKKPNLELTLETKLKFQGYAGLSATAGDVVINLVVLNKGHRTVFIDKALLLLPNNLLYASMKNISRLPAELPPEQGLTFEFDAIDLLKKFKPDNSKFELALSGLVVDKLKREYRSGEITIKSSEIKAWQKVLNENRL